MQTTMLCTVRADGAMPPFSSGVDLTTMFDNKLDMSKDAAITFSCIATADRFSGAGVGVTTANNIEALAALFWGVATKFPSVYQSGGDGTLRRLAPLNERLDIAARGMRKFWSCNRETVAKREFMEEL